MPVYQFVNHPYWIVPQGSELWRTCYYNVINNGSFIETSQRAPESVTQAKTQLTESGCSTLHKTSDAWHNENDICLRAKRAPPLRKGLKGNTSEIMSWSFQWHKRLFQLPGQVQAPTNAETLLSGIKEGPFKGLTRSWSRSSPENEIRHVVFIKRSRSKWKHSF